ncbi:MAG: pectate lyase, partial [Pseudopedobacter saltans]
SAVEILETGRRITVEDCISQNPISEIGGQRRYTFFTRGQQTLFQRCYAAGGYHDFSVGFTAAGPNAFVQCESERPYSFSGTMDKWASGVLFDVVSVDGNAIRIRNREQDGRGAGWSGANCLLWNCTAAMIDNYKPPTAQNWALGSWSQFAGNGYWNESNNSLNPRSFFYTQLAERLGKKSDNQSFIMDISTDASSSPSIAVAQELTAEAVKPKALLINWIKQASEHNTITVNVGNVKVFDRVVKHGPIIVEHKMKVKNAWLVNENDEVLTGTIQEVPWWTGGVEGDDLAQAKKKLAITRFVPGRVGQGLTDDIQEVVDSMVSNNIVGLNQHYALWYERRRDDHERIRRMDGDVWPPFYELPFKRSGVDSAWDGLSKYDLTQYNQWYWWRMKEFASIGIASNRVLLHQNYFQHNIIEAGAHYADFPWRTANNINNTGFNEPVNFAGDKRIFYAEQFYDINRPTRKLLHQQYIEKCLDNFRDNSNVIQFTGEEFTGPL